MRRDETLATGWCMEPHDLVLAKCAAGRERDWEFAREAIRHGIVDANELLRRVGDLPLARSARERIAHLLQAIVAEGLPTERQPDVGG